LTARPYLQSRMRTRTAASSDNDNAAFGVQPQGYRVAVRLAAKAGYRRF
jgi:acetyl-CoA carboxylase alpha subunit